MPTTVEKELIDLMNNLIQLDYDAIEAYRAAIDRLDEMAYKAKLREFMQDHERHTRDLGALVRNMGGDPAKQGDMKQVLTKGKVVIMSLKGDKGILQAMKSNEDQTNQKYEQALQNRNLTPDVRQLLEKNLADERRHRAWIVEQLDRI